MRRAYERLLVEVQTSCRRRPRDFEDARNMKQLPRATEGIESSLNKLRRQAVYSVEGRTRKKKTSWMSPEDHK